VSVRFVIKASRSMVRIDTTSVHQEVVAGLTGKCWWPVLRFEVRISPKAVPGAASP
jgi:hypothetical protein